MSNEEQRKKRDNRDTERIRWELNEIKDDLMDELDDLHDDFKDEILDLKEAGEDIKDDLKEELIEIKEEEEEVFQEIGNVKGELENLGENAKEKIEQTQIKLEHLREKIKRHEAKYGAKIRKSLEKAKKRSVKRINISVDPEMSDEWKSWAGDLGASVSELVRKSMKFVKNNIGDIEKLEDWGKNMEKIGRKLEKEVKKSGIKELGERLNGQFEGKKGKKRVKIHIEADTDKERIKKRVYGLIKLHKNIPIEKLAKTLNRSVEFAENIIYELAADGIEGSLEENIFKFTSTSEEVISKLNDIIDKILK